MFHAVRNWWSGGPGKVTARLFLFEFIVVVAGVLAAQVLANWVRDRGDLRAMEDAKARAEIEIADVMFAAMVTKAAIPCFEQRMRQVMRDAGVGTIDGRLAVRPAIKSFGISPLPDQSALLLRRRYGDQWMATFNAFAGNTRDIDLRTSDIATKWGRIGLAAPENGQVAAGDRLAAREAAVDILADLRGLRINTDNLLKWGRRLGVSPSNGLDEAYGVARSCDAIWKSGRSDPPLGMR